MSPWTWVLIGLCAAGVSLAFGSIVPVLTAALRLRARMKQLKQSQLMDSMQALQLQTNRLSHTAKELKPLVDRAKTAISTLHESVEMSGADEARAAVEQSATDVRALVDDLR